MQTKKFLLTQFSIRGNKAKNELEERLADFWTTLRQRIETFNLKETEHHASNSLPHPFRFELNFFLMSLWLIFSVCSAGTIGGIQLMVPRKYQFGATKADAYSTNAYRQMHTRQMNRARGIRVSGAMICEIHQTNGTSNGTSPYKVLLCLHGKGLQCKTCKIYNANFTL